MKVIQNSLPVVILFNLFATSWTHFSINIQYKAPDASVFIRLNHFRPKFNDWEQEILKELEKGEADKDIVTEGVIKSTSHLGIIIPTTVPVELDDKSKLHDDSVWEGWLQFTMVERTTATEDK